MRTFYLNDEALTGEVEAKKRMECPVFKTVCKRMSRI